MLSTLARLARQDAAPLLSALLVLGGAREAAAQSDPVVSSSNMVHFKSASVNEDGYIHANVMVDYAFRVCGDRVRLYYGVRGGSAQGSTTYWYRGHNYGSAQTPLPDRIPPFSVEFRVHFAARPIYAAVTNPNVGSDLTCSGGTQYVNLGAVTDYDRNAKTNRDKQDVLNRFTFDVGITHAPMRNSEVESGYAREIAAAKKKAAQDSLDARHAAKARADSVAAAKVARAEKARSDSIARARSASHAATPAVGTTRSATGAASSAAGSATSATRTAATPRYAAEDAAVQRARAEQARRDSLNRAGVQARAQLQAEMDARSEATNRSIRESREREAQQSAAIDAAFAPLQAQAREYARAKAEREEAEHERNEALYQQRRAEHFAEAEKAFVDAPWRPTCTERDVQGTLPIDAAVSGVLTLQSCRTKSGTSAAQYELVVDRTRPIVLSVSAPQFYETIELSQAGKVLGSATSYTPIEATLPAGRYLVTVSTEGRGETGGFSVIANRGAFSHTRGLHVGLDLGAASSSLGSVSKSSSVGQLRLGLGFGQYVTVLGQYGSAADGSVEGLEFLEFGARVYVRRSVERLRPYLQVTTGKRSYYVGDATMSGDTWSGKGTTYGAGAEWFLVPNIGIEAGLFRAAGSMTLDSSPGAPQDMAQTRLTFGMTFHK